MHRRLRMFRLVAIAVLGFATVARAQDAPSSQGSGRLIPAPVYYPSPSAEPNTGAGYQPAPMDQSATAPGEQGQAEGLSASAAKAVDPSKAMYGLAFRWRWISVPGWFLDAFTQKNVPLSTFSCFGLEGFRRKTDRDDPNRTWELSVALGYQNMSPPDGYWLGDNKDPVQDTDLVQFDGLSLITMDAAFVSRQYFTPYFGIHYGAGLGLAIVRGRILRTSAQYDPGSGYQVRTPGGGPPGYGSGQVICTQDAKCNQDPRKGPTLSQSETGQDLGPYNAHRFQETSVPGALPIINLLVGIDFRVPIPQYHQAVEFRLEGGFFDAFFIGLAAGYQM